MKGRLKKINDKWVVEYSGVSYKGGNPKQLGNYTKKVEKKTLPLHPNFVTMTDYVWVKGVKVYDGDEVKFTQVLVNPMGREVGPNDLGQNQSKCVWYARLDLRKNFYCGDEVDYGEQCDFQCDRCVDATGVDYGYLPKEEPKQGTMSEAIKQVISNQLKQETLEDKLKELVLEWQKRQEKYYDIAYENVDNVHTNRKFTYKAMATRDCWKELLKLIENEK
jgi:hypothetical protein